MEREAALKDGIRNHAYAIAGNMKRLADSDGDHAARISLSASYRAVGGLKVPREWREASQKAYALAERIIWPKSEKYYTPDPGISVGED